MRRDATGASGHVNTKPSICKWDAFCKSGVYARKDSCLTTGDLPCVANAKAATTEGRETGFDRVAEVSRGRSRKAKALSHKGLSKGPNGTPRGD